MSEDNFLLSDTIKSKKIILNEKDLSEDLSSLHVVASTNISGGGGGASDQDISSLSAANTSISQDLNEGISSLIVKDQELSEDLNSISQDINSANQAISSNSDSVDSLNEDISSLTVANQGLENGLDQQVSSLSFVEASTNSLTEEISSLKAADQNIQDTLNKDVSSLTVANQVLENGLDQQVSSLSFVEASTNSLTEEISSLKAADQNIQDTLNKDVSSLTVANQVLENGLDQQVSSLSFVEASTNSLTEEISSLKAADQNIQDTLNEDISSLKAADQNIQDTLNEDISSLSLRELGSIEQVSIDYSLSQDSAISAEYRFNESIQGLTNISDSLSNSADAVLDSFYNHSFNQTVNGVEISVSQNNTLTLPLLQPNSDQFISFPLWLINGYGGGTFNHPLFGNNGWMINYDKSVAFGFEMQITAGTTTLNIIAYEEAFVGNYTLNIENQQSGDMLYEHSNNGGTLATVIRIASGITTASEWITDINTRTGGHFEISLVSGNGDDPISNFTNETYSSSSAFRELLVRSIQGNGYSETLSEDLSIITIKQTGEVYISNNSSSKLVILGALDFSDVTQFFWFSNEGVSIPYVIMGTDYSLIDKVEWYLANQLNAVNNLLPEDHAYKNTAPEGSIQEQLVTTDSFFSSFYQDYLQLKQTVSSLSAS